MEKEETGQRRGGIYNYFGGATINNLVINNGTYTKHGTEHHHYSSTVDDEKHECSDNKTVPAINSTSVEDGLNVEKLARAIENCQKFFWGNSAYAVVYCLCRDEFNSNLSQTAFERMVEELPYNGERDYQCPTGTIANAFSNNAIFKTPISRWDAQGCTLRVHNLLKMLKKELEL